MQDRSLLKGERYFAGSMVTPFLAPSYRTASPHSALAQQLNDTRTKMEKYSYGYGNVSLVNIIYFTLLIMKKDLASVS